MLNPILKLAPIALLAACASLTQEQCQTGDWASIGYVDGTHGRSETYIKQHREACADYGISPDKSAWLLGRLKGLQQYCTPENAYNIGRSGNQINAVCTQDVANLRLANLYGVRYHEISSQIESSQSELDTVLGLLTSDDGTMDAQTRKYYKVRIKELRRSINELYDERATYSVAP